MYEVKVCDAEKLIPNLGDKTKYVLHYKNLQLYFSLGMKLTKTHGGWARISAGLLDEKIYRF